MNIQTRYEFSASSSFSTNDASSAPALIKKVNEDAAKASIKGVEQLHKMRRMVYENIFKTDVSKGFPRNKTEQQPSTVKIIDVSDDEIKPQPSAVKITDVPKADDKSSKDKQNALNAFKKFVETIKDCLEQQVAFPADCITTEEQNTTLFNDDTRVKILKPLMANMMVYHIATEINNKKDSLLEDLVAKKIEISAKQKNEFLEDFKKYLMNTFFNHLSQNQTEQQTEETEILIHFKTLCDGFCQRLQNYPASNASSLLNISEMLLDDTLKLDTFSEIRDEATNKINDLLVKDVSIFIDQTEQDIKNHTIPAVTNLFKKTMSVGIPQDHLKAHATNVTAKSQEKNVTAESAQPLMQIDQSLFSAKTVASATKAVTKQAPVAPNMLKKTLSANIPHSQLKKHIAAAITERQEQNANAESAQELLHVDTNLFSVETMASTPKVATKQAPVAQNMLKKTMSANIPHDQLKKHIAAAIAERQEKNINAESAQQLM